MQIKLQKGEQISLEDHVPKEILADALSKLFSSVLNQPKEAKKESA